mgnify:CR=1 FL=1
MDIFLRFKNKKHAEAYSYDLEQQVHNRFFMIGTGACVASTIYVIMYAFNPKVGNQASQILLTLRFILTTLSLLGYYLLKMYMKRIKPLAPKLLVILDIICLAAQFVIYPISGNVAVDNFSKLGVYVWAWCAAFCAFTMYIILLNWWMKMFNLVLQMGFFLYFVIKREPVYTPILTLALIGVLSFVFLSYMQEMFQKRDFLEKRKLYDNYEALKRIFDDICQGIIIVDTKFNTIYANRTVEAMFNRQSSQKGVVVEELFAEVQVKTVIPPNMSPITEGAMITQDSNIQVIIIVYQRIQLTTNIIF